MVLAVFGIILVLMKHMFASRSFVINLRQRTLFGQAFVFLSCTVIQIFLLGPNALLAQKDFLLSMPEENQYSFNPAYAGLESSLDVTIWGREQWSGLPGRPNTQSIVMHMPLYRLKGGGGLRISNDKLGPFQYVKLELGYDYVSASDNIIWSLGIAAGINQISFDGAQLRTTDGIYTGNIVNHNDPLLPDGKHSRSAPVISLGAYFISGALEGGISVQDIQIGSATFESNEQKFDWSQKTVLNAYAEYGMDIGEQLYAYPNIFVKYDFQDIQALFKFNVQYENLLNVGLGVRGFSGNTLESLVVSAGYNIDSHFSMHYSYDIGLGGLASEASGSHEIILRYNLNKSIGKGKIPKIIGNPRYL